MTSMPCMPYMPPTTSILQGTSMHRTNKDITEYCFKNKLPADKQQELDMAYSIFKQALYRVVQEQKDQLGKLRTL